ncbi:MAG: hypothetical protein KAJ46_09030, partial [Sedimentisphaerales bacterium]|nr:hypothetical protein [Sedimentisphaerales bacterium]
KLTLGGNTNIVLAGNVTSNSDITLDDDATATGGAQTIDAGAGALTAGAINKTTAGKLTLSGDTGIALAGNVISIDDITISNAATAIGGVRTIDAGAGTLTAGVITKTTAGKLTLGGDTGIALSDDITSDDDITLDDAVTATGDIQTIDAGAGTLTAGAINKTTAGKLTLNGDTGIVLSGNVISIDDITIDDATTATGDSQTFDAGTGSLSAKAIAKTTSGDLNLAGDSGISLSGNVSGIDSVTLENNVSLTGASNQTLTATNDKLHVMGTLTKTDSGDLTLTGGTGIELNGTVDVQQGSLMVRSAVTAGQNLLAKNDLILDHSATLTGTSDQQLKASDGKLETGQLTKTGAGALILTADEINLSGTVANDTRAINLQPGSATTAVRIGGTDDDINDLLELSAADLANLQDGFGSITIGLEAGTGAVTVDNGDTDVVFSDPTTIQTSGTITVASTIRGSNDASIELKGAGSGTTLNAGIYTDGQTIRLCDSRINGTTIVLDTTSEAS